MWDRVGWGEFSDGLALGNARQQRQNIGWTTALRKNMGMTKTIQKVAKY